MTLGTGGRRGLNTWLARLPMEAKEKDEWCYWQTDLLLECGHEAEVKEILHQFMQQRGFYPAAAAQRIGEEYELGIDETPQNADSVLTQGPGIARVCELMYWNFNNTTCSEWANLVKSRSKAEQAQLARYTFNNQWWDLNIQAAIVGRLWDHLEERFPLAYNDLFKHHTSRKETPQSYAMTIARQESAWNPKVRSLVGTSGLIQTMPGTATHTVKMFFTPDYSNPGQLLDPETSINIDTSYLQCIYQQFGSSRIFSLAAYNAGPGRVRTRLGNSAGCIDTVVLIESILFSKVHGYIRNMLVYDAYYRYLMGDKPALMSTTERGCRY